MKTLTQLLLEERNKPHKWTKDECKELAEKCRSKNDFQTKYSAAYSASYRNGWLKDFSFKYNGKNAGYWDEEKCKNAAKECKTRSEFSIKYVAAYTKARKEGWIETYYWLKNDSFNKYTDPVDSVYAYEFTDLNAVYVGRTLIRLQKNRDQAHIFQTEKDAVAKFSKDNNVPVPKMKIVATDLTLEQGAKQEGKWVEKYREQGWTILNRIKTGSIGSLGKGKWNVRTCREEAKKYKTRTEFRKGSSGAYHVASREGWINSYDWLDQSRKTNKYWNKETCYKAAKECTNRSEFAKKYWQGWYLSKQEGWLDDYDWFVDGHQKATQERTIWNKETCYQAAKKCSNRKEFATKYVAAYSKARKEGWLDDYEWFETNWGKWNEETCREEAKKYKRRGEFQKGNGSAYQVALKNGWLDTYDWFAPSASAKK